MTPAFTPDSRSWNCGSNGPLRWRSSKNRQLQTPPLAQTTALGEKSQTIFLCLPCLPRGAIVPLSLETGVHKPAEG
ncbi:hypothetical protein AVEN_54700-1 [Araneus ventricosus]|uniref:Uncharacterized protein n=1 Tax=Araneus ventricosus TaxID=182803 RepID=A0A4Y2UVB6_ARAVE|nr:hypothetical protein AVEN_54700-1 [Araneus ventricosus]